MLAGSQARLRSSEKINKILAMSDSDEEELDKEAVGKKVEYISLHICPLLSSDSRGVAGGETAGVQGHLLLLRPGWRRLHWGGGVRPGDENIWLGT